MTLTNKQEEALKTAVQRYHNGEKYTIISGYAGSGKTTLVKFIIAALGIDPDDVGYVAFTGKAAMVLQQKGCKNAVTAHKLLYKALLQKDGSYKFIPRTELEHDYKVVVVDEVSMLPKIMWERLMMHNVYVLACGDPGQLPPVDKDQDNHLLDNPHVFLDEIMRQAQESEIIQLSMHVREGQPISTFKASGNQVMLIPQSQVSEGMYKWADQIICGKNVTRFQINNFARKVKGFGPEPQIGDKIVCDSNHWDYFSNLGNWCLTNGVIGEITSFKHKKVPFPGWTHIPIADYLITDIQLADGDGFKSIPIDYKFLTTGTPALTGRQTAMIKSSKKIVVDPPMDFEYGYAITCHRSQGSEWPRVLLYEEPFGTKEDKTRWLYTAVTRAQDKLVVLTK